MKEFAANKKVLSFGLDDYISGRTSLDLRASGPISSCQSPISTATHRFNEATGTLVPLHLQRNRNALVAALRSCKNLADIRFSKNWGDRDKYHGRLQSALAAEDDDDDDDQDQPVLFVITSSVAYVLSLAEEAGISLEQIFVSDVWPDVRPSRTLGRRFFGTVQGYFRYLESLVIKLVEDPSESLFEV